MSDYATAAELKTEIGKTTAGDDATLALLVTSASDAIDRYCNRPDGFIALAAIAVTTRYFTGSGLPYQWIDECVGVTSVAVKDSVSDDENAYMAWTVGVIGTTTAADVFPASGDPECPDFTRTPYTMLVCGPNGAYSKFTSGRFVGQSGFKPTVNIARGLPTVKVAARWGYAATVPPAIKQATIMQAARWYKRLQSGMADALTTAELGQLLYTKKIDPDIQFILTEGRYVRPAVGRR